MTLTQEDKDRIEGRKYFESALADVVDESASFAEGFKRAVLKYAMEEKPSVVGSMGDDESRDYGNEICTFGKYAGNRYDEVPADYLGWIADSNVQLRRYLNSRRIRDERASCTTD